MIRPSPASRDFPQAAQTASRWLGEARVAICVSNHSRSAPNQLGKASITAFMPAALPSPSKAATARRLSQRPNKGRRSGRGPASARCQAFGVHVSAHFQWHELLLRFGREKLVQAALGLTAAQAQRVFGKAVVTGGMLDETAIAMVMGEKKDIIRDSKALEFYAVAEMPDDVGGLGILKSWLRLRQRAFTQQARDYGLPASRGMALIGIPGTGKSSSRTAAFFNSAGSAPPGNVTTMDLRVSAATA
jgi:hypothetical protein